MRSSSFSHNIYERERERETHLFHVSNPIVLSYRSTCHKIDDDNHGNVPYF